MCDIYFYDPSTKVFTGTGEATTGDMPGSYLVPHNATLIPPPDCIQEGFAAKFNEVGQTWDMGYKPIEPTCKEKRRNAYALEADPFLIESQYYQAETDGFSLLGMEAEASIAEYKAIGALKDYAAKKLEIRHKYPEVLDSIVD